MLRRLHLYAALFLIVAPLSLTAAASAKKSPRSNPPAHPAITGISHISVYDKSPSQAGHYYVDVIGCTRAEDPENPAGARYYLNAHQWVEVLPLPSDAGSNRLNHI